MVYPFKGTDEGSDAGWAECGGTFRIEGALVVPNAVRVATGRSSAAVDIGLSLATSRQEPKNKEHVGCGEDHGRQRDPPFRPPR